MNRKSMTLLGRDEDTSENLRDITPGAERQPRGQLTELVMLVHPWVNWCLSPWFTWCLRLLGCRALGTRKLLETRRSFFSPQSIAAEFLPCSGEICRQELSLVAAAL